MTMMKEKSTFYKQTLKFGSQSKNHPSLERILSDTKWLQGLISKANWNLIEKS